MNSRFYDCEGDGIGSIVNPNSAPAAPSSGASTGAWAPVGELGDGVGDSLSVDIENSTIMGTKQDAFHFMSIVPTKDITIRVENSEFGNAQGPAVVAVDQNKSTERAEIDFGGKDPESIGGNCFVGSTNLAMEVTGYDVTAKSNWWGRPKGPLPTNISVTDGHLDVMPALRAAPPACKATK